VLSGSGQIGFAFFIEVFWHKVDQSFRAEGFSGGRFRLADTQKVHSNIFHLRSGRGARRRGFDQLFHYPAKRIESDEMAVFNRFRK
jgi:hypothetical protein